MRRLLPGFILFAAFAAIAALVSSRVALGGGRGNGGARAGRALAPAEAKSYAAVWTRQAPEVVGADGKPAKLPGNLGAGGAAYDAKRARCVLYGCGLFNKKRNDLWAYDAKADTWALLQANEPEPAPDARPAPYFPGGVTSLAFSYDARRDLYWLLAGKPLHLWSCNPDTRVWKKGPAITLKGKAPRETVALGYHPGLNALVTQHGVLDIKTGAIRRPAPKPAARLFYSWQPSSALTPGGFTRPDARGRFLVFGEFAGAAEPVPPRIWAFDATAGAWSRLEAAGAPPPPGRSQANFVYHAGLDVWVLFGGQVREEKKKRRLADTWVYAPHLGVWGEVTPARSPPQGGAIWYDAARDKVVLLTDAGETWTLQLTPSAVAKTPVARAERRSERHVSRAPRARAPALPVPPAPPAEAPVAAPAKPDKNPLARAPIEGAWAPAGRVPLRSFEPWRFDKDGKRIAVNPVQGYRVLGRKAAAITDARATHAGHSLLVPADFPGEAVVYKPGGKLGKIRLVAYDLYLPEDAPPDVRAIFFLKDKDGLWFQSSPPDRLKPGWNALHADLRAGMRATEPRGHYAAFSELAAPEVAVLGWRIWSDTAWRGAVLLDNVRGWLEANGGEALVIRDLAAPARTARYETFELTFDLSREFDNPFDPDEVDIRADFLHVDGGGRVQSVPAFYGQAHTRRRWGEREEVVPVGRPHWTVRFTPASEGEYRYRLVVRVRGKELLRTGMRSLRVTPSDAPGFIRRAKKGPYFERDDGSWFYPIGHNLRSPTDERGAQVLGVPVPPDRGTYAYDRFFEKMAANGENACEVWMASWWCGIEWTREWRGYRGVGRYNLANAWKLDYVLAAAKKHGISVQIVVDNHGKYSTWCDEEWSTSPYNRLFVDEGRVRARAQPGGFLSRPDQFFTHSRARKLYKQKMRYIIARWAHATNVIGFTLVSEIDLIGSSGGFHKRGEVHAWVKDVLGYVHQLDPYGHLYTIHYSGNHSKIDPVVAMMPGVDYVTGDGYRGGGSFVPLALATAVSNRRFGKPFMITEYGGNWNGTTRAGLEADLHSGLWASWMTSAAGTPYLWWFDYIDLEDRYFHFKAFSRFVAGEDKRGRSFITTRSSARSKGGGRALSSIAFTDARGGYAWVYDAPSMTVMPPEKKRPRFTGAELTLKNLSPGAYAVEFWNTWTGEVVKRLDVAAGADGRLALTCPSFTCDIAIKVKKK